MMIGGGGAARQHELGQREPSRDPQVVRLEPRPDRIERDEPREQRLVDGGGMGAGQRLVEMVVGVDEARQHDMARRVECCVDALRRLPFSHPLSDPRPVDDKPALRAVGEDGQWVFDPSPHRARASDSPRRFHWDEVAERLSTGAAGEASQAGTRP